MRKHSKRAVLALAGTVTIAGSVAVSSPAMAASTPIGACGGGSYHVVDKHDLGPSVIYLMYNGSTNCVVNWKDSPSSAFIDVWIWRQSDGEGPYDGGNFSTYAGPVKLYAAGDCIIWGGSTKTSSDWKSWESHWEHCG